MDVAFISEFVDGQRVFRYVDARPGPSVIHVGGADPLEESYCQRIIDGRLPELIHNACDLPAALELPATQALPVGAHISVPIRFTNGVVYGTLCCFSSSPDQTLNERDLGMMRVFADFTARQLEHEALGREELEAIRARVQSVLDSQSFSTVFQPIVHVLEHRIIGYEALTRFSAVPVRPPDQWFREAGQVGLQVDLELAAIRKALAVLNDLPNGAYLSLNASAETVQSGVLGPLLESSALPRIVLEVTEHDVIPDYEKFSAMLAPMRKNGLSIAVDDAGAGYASFRHILNLKPDVIKLDISLTRNIDIDLGRRALAVALIQFAADTGSKIVAEGVETQGELDVLRSLRVNKAQGYLLGRPMPFERLATELCRKDSP
jgi:EAL domain-containing protein (putative c-di-GMP-specific phosphodiesterase class I)